MVFTISLKIEKINNERKIKGGEIQMKNEKGISLIKLLIIIIAVIAVFFIISNIILKSEEENSKKLEQARLAARQEASYNIGDKITTNLYEITVTNVEERTKVGVPKYYKTVDDYYYTLVCATIEIKNITNEAQRIYDYRPDFSLYFKLEDENGLQYSNDPTFTTYYQYEFDNFDVTELTIEPNETVTVNPVFKMDKSKYQNRNFYLKVLVDTALVKIK